MKVCSICHVAKLATTEFFNRRPERKSGITSSCRICRSQIKRGVSRDNLNPEHTLRSIERNTCLQCGTGYTIPPSVSLTGPQRKGYCSQSCHLEARDVPFNDPETQRVQLFGKGAEGKFALVSPEDYDRVMTKRWFYGTSYACLSRYKRGCAITLHRWLLDAPEDMYVDHINGNRLDNQRNNLRICLPSENNFNQAKTSSPTSSKYKGVCWNKNKRRWQSNICCKGKRTQLGLFRDEINAALAYDRKAAVLFGEFARLNFPVG